MVFGCTSNQGANPALPAQPSPTPAAQPSAIPVGDQINGCLALPLASSDVCLSKIALQQKNASICVSVSDMLQQLNCFGSAAEASGGAGACTQFSANHLPSRVSCFAGAALKQNDPSVCNGIAMEGYNLEAAKSYCVAFAMQDSALCSNISDSAYSGTCTVLLATIKQNVSLCGAASRSFHDVCIASVAAGANDPSICENQIFTGRDPSASLATCYRIVASKSGNGELCERISNLMQKDGCYCDMAVTTKVSAWYEKINNTGIKNMCGKVVFIPPQTN